MNITLGRIVGIAWAAGASLCGSLLEPLVADEKSAAPLSPAESAKRFTVAADLEWTLVLAEPVIQQPVFINFDERGRMWVVQYLQYPEPAGLKMLSRDRFWRAAYDRVPPAPPNHFPGADRITIHEDTDGDGQFDRHKTFLEGLNIVTAVAHGRGGVWVMNPPYLLFYPDRNRDDVPDSDPEVHLEGFGLEDTHSVANSLRWGPDGWLYGAQGSTVTGNIKRPGIDRDPVHSMGQLIWRYHPESRSYEVFAEGGGNAFGCEIDAQGRIFSGHNGGNTRGFHYQQGAYLQKGFEKHGPLSNPYAFGYFPPMPHPPVERFTHNFIIYDGGALPEHYDGKLIGIEPLQGRIVWSEILPDRSSFKTTDLGYLVTSSDPWFRPVDIKLGPDGAIYVADWHDRQVNHFRNHEGQIDKNTGRIYRLRAKTALVAKPAPDLGRLPADALIARLGHKNKWVRQEALRLLGDRKDRAIIPELKRLLRTPGKPAASRAASGIESMSANDRPSDLEVFWALYLSGGLDEPTAHETLRHPDPFVRLWTVRLLGDAKRSLSSDLLSELTQLAAKESNLEVRGQLASTAKRLSGPQALLIVRELLAHDQDADDNRIPLLIWWALEAKAESDREQVLVMFSDPAVWTFRLIREHIAARLMRRYAAAGTREDLLTCARLLNLAPNVETAAPLLAGFEAGARALTVFPEELIQALAKWNGDSVALGLRRGVPEAVDTALAVVADRSAAEAKRLAYVQIFAEVNRPRCVPVLLRLLEGDDSVLVQAAALGALQRYDEPEIGIQVAARFAEFDAEVQLAALNLLASRPRWALELVRTIQAGRIEPSRVPDDVRLKLRRHRSPELQEALSKLWTQEQDGAQAQLDAVIARCAAAIRSGSGDPYEGVKLFNLLCGSCHQLFGTGGQIGPDLTAHRRDDLESMLLSIVNPNAEIRGGYETYLVSTRDGRAVSGFLVETTDRNLVLRGIDGVNVSLLRAEIAEMQPAELSLMPEGLLDSLSDQQVRDLFAYLRSTQPLPK